MERTKFSFSVPKIPGDITYILGLFIATRIALTAIGYAAHQILGESARAAMNRKSWYNPIDGFNAFTEIWTVFDGDWYISIARAGYSATPLNMAGMSNYAFFPLYPALMRLTSWVIHDYALAGIVVSNICLLVACYYIYKFVGLDCDQATARRSVKYLILFPTAFVFSAVLSESLFVALAIACLYYARKGNWPVAGTLGFFISLTRPPGMIIAIPLLYEYIRQNAPTLAAWKDHALQRLAKPEIGALLMPPLGLGLFAAGNYYLTGDVLGFLRIQSAWSGHMTIPMFELLRRLSIDQIPVFTGAIVTVAALILMLLFVRRVDFGAWILGIALIIIPLCASSSDYSMLRYLAVVFPLFIIMAGITKDRRVDIALTAVMVVVQGILMVQWTMWSMFVV